MKVRLFGVARHHLGDSGVSRRGSGTSGAPAARRCGLKRTCRLSVVVMLLTALGTETGIGQVRFEASTNGTRSGVEDSRDIVTIDRFVPHVSTALANEGDPVELFVRERVQRGHHSHRPVVLMIQGATTPAVPVFDLRFRNYSWMTFLARAGFDVFTMDLQGYGASPRPRMDDPCNTQASQQPLLIPRTLLKPCAPSYPFKMAIQSDWDEIDRVIDYLRDLRGAEKVSLIAWSRGGPRAGGYAAQHPEKVDKLFLYSPAMYNRTGPSNPPLLPEPGFLMQLGSLANTFSTWDGQVGCENQFRPEIRDPIGTTILDLDPVGRTWGDGTLWRAPLQNTLWGWNAEAAQQIAAPTLIIRGEFDNQGGGEGLQRNLFADLGTNQKVFVKVACASHNLVWENQHMVLLRASREWLNEGTFAEQGSGSFFVDAEGHVHNE
jgi:pimeloyl-ACP methyl ester carboxylesterase